MIGRGRKDIEPFEGETAVDICPTKSRFTGDEVGVTGPGPLDGRHVMMDEASAEPGSEHIGFWWWSSSAAAEAGAADGEQPRRETANGGASGGVAESVSSSAETGAAVSIGSASVGFVNEASDDGGAIAGIVDAADDDDDVEEEVVEEEEEVCEVATRPSVTGRMGLGRPEPISRLAATSESMSMLQ